MLTAWDPAVQRQALGRIGELFSDIADLRLSDSGYAQIAEELEQARALVGYDPAKDFGDEWSLADFADGRSEVDVLATV